jgi:dihydroxyacetone kinase-like protein
MAVTLPRPSSEEAIMSTATVTMKKFVNDPEAIVAESVTGLAAAHGDLLRYDADAQIIVRADAPVAGKVALVSGGGSGHEPLHGGFVGVGMLDAACPGAVFTSPVPEQMLAATKAVDSGAGVVHIVKNYTGDVMNFKLAAEDAADEGINVESVLIDDDVAVQDSLYTAGRRGVGATVLAEKIAGAAAERGDGLDDVAGLARRVNERARSFGIALSSCIPPAAGTPIFDLPEGEMEVGIGIHGEPGRRREPLAGASEIADLMVEAVLSDREPADGAKVLPFVNGMGGTPQLELYLLYGEVDAALRKAGVEPVRRLVGSYITSLEMAGASLTLLELDDELTELWDAPVRTPALRWGV